MMKQRQFVEHRRVRRVVPLFVCAVVEASGLGCGTQADQEIDLSAATVCTAVTAGGPWWNQAFAPQTGQFTVELTATPSAPAIDAVIGLGDGSVDGFGALAAAIRFNPAGTIDVRAGSSYRANVGVSYQAGVAYHFRLDVDLTTHTYSVWQLAGFGRVVPIAQGYPFRTEQAGINRLSVAAAKIDSATGTLEICDLTVGAAAGPPPGCLIAKAGGGFVTTPVPDATVVSAVAFRVFPGAPNLDAVIGLSAAVPTRFSELAAAVRLAPSGAIDVRDGDAYRGDGRLYRTSEQRFEIVADLPSHRYSVFDYETKIAAQARFRTEQRAVSHLAQLSAIVDGAEGSVVVCEVQGRRSTNAAYTREGEYAVVPLANDEAVIGNGSTIQRIDAGGQTIAEVGGAGRLAADAAGNVFSARIVGATLTIDNYGPDLAARWTVSRSVPDGARLLAIATDATGAVVVAYGVPGDASVTVVRVTAEGVCASQLSIAIDPAGPAVPAVLIALDGDQPVVLTNTGAEIAITRYSATGDVIWVRRFAGPAEITALIVDPLHNVVFGGVLHAELDFGGGPLPLLWNGEQDLNGFVVKLSPAGAHVLSANAFMYAVFAVASNGTRVVVSGLELANFVRPRVMYFDDAGTRTPWTGDPIFHSDIGRAEAVAMGASGRVWLTLQTRQAPGPYLTWPYLVALTP